MKKYIVSNILILISIFSFGQIKEIERLNVMAENYYIDKIGNYYFKIGNSITKTNQQLDTIAIYDKKSFGKISYIDVSNPFVNLVFYKEINQLIFLDNYLSPLRTPVLLDDLELYNVDVVCCSEQGGFWVFDAQNSRVCLINNNLQKIQEGSNLYRFVAKSNVKFICESNNYILLLFDNSQIIILDKFGNYYKNINIDSIDNSKLLTNLNDNLYYLNNDKLIIHNIKTNEEKQITVPDYNYRDFKIFGNNLYFLTEKELIICKFDND